MLVVCVFGFWCVYGSRQHAFVTCNTTWDSGSQGSVVFTGVSCAQTQMLPYIHSDVSL